MSTPWDSITNYQFPPFDEQRSKAIGLTTTVLGALGIPPVHAHDIVPRVHATVFRGRSTKGDEIGITAVLADSTSEMLLMMGLDVPVRTDDDLAVFANEGMSKFHLPFVPGAVDGRPGMSIRYPVCLGLLSEQAVQIAMFRLAHAYAWALSKADPQSAPFDFTMQLPLIDADAVSNSFQKRLKSEGLRVSRSRTELNSWTLVFNTPERPESKMAAVFDGSYPDAYTVGGTFVPKLPLPKEKLAPILGIAGVRNVALTLKPNVEQAKAVECYYPFVPGEMDHSTFFTCVLKPISAAANVAELMKS